MRESCDVEFFDQQEKELRKHSLWPRMPVKVDVIPPPPANSKQPGVTKSLLYNGSRFQGSQKSKGNSYDVEVVLQVSSSFWKLHEKFIETIMCFQKFILCVTLLFHSFSNRNLAPRFYMANRMRTLLAISNR